MVTGLSSIATHFQRLQSSPPASPALSSCTSVAVKIQTASRSQRTEARSKYEFEDGPFKVDPVAAFQDAAAGLLDDEVFTLPSTTDPINYCEAMKSVQR